MGEKKEKVKRFHIVYSLLPFFTLVQEYAIVAWLLLGLKPTLFSLFSGSVLLLYFFMGTSKSSVDSFLTYFPLSLCFLFKGSILLMKYRMRERGEGRREDTRDLV